MSDGSDAPAPYVVARDVGAAAPPAQGIDSAKVYDGPDAAVVTLAFAPGAALSEHTSRWPVALHVHEGAGRATVGDAELGLLPGTWLRIAPGVAHGITAASAMRLTLTLIKAQP